MKYQNIKTKEYEKYTETRDSVRDTQKTGNMCKTEQELRPGVFILTAPV